MIVVNDIHQWNLMLPGAAVEFVNENPRAATLDFNVAGVANIYLQLLGKIDGQIHEPVLLARVEGRETVKFAVPGAYRVFSKTEDVDVYVFSRDSTKVHRVVLDEETYTTLHEPRVRDENLERIVAQMNRGVERRMAAQRAQFERELAVVREQANDSATSDSGDEKPIVQPAPAPAQGEDGNSPTPPAAS